MENGNSEPLGKQMDSSPDELASALAGLAEGERKAGNWESALQYYLEAGAAAEIAGQPFTLAQHLIDASDMLQRAGKSVEAEPYLEEALLIYTSRKDTPRAELTMAVCRLKRLWAELGHVRATELMPEAELSTSPGRRSALPPD